MSDGERYLKVVWQDDGRHSVEVVGLQRRSDVERLIRAAQRHAFSCQMRGIAIDADGTQVPTVGETDDMPLGGRGDDQ